MPDFYYIRPDEMFAIYGAVAGGADTNYDDDWLVDGRPGRPARAATGTQTWTITNTAKDVSLIAVCNHNVDAGKTISIGGDVTSSLTGPTLPSNGIPLNPWVAPTLVAGVDTLTVGVVGNSAALIIGEVIAGKKRTLERNLKPRPQFSIAYQTVELAAEFDSLLAYDKGVVARQLRGEVIVTDSELANLLAWVDSTRGNTRPSLIIPNASVQDAWLVKFTDFGWEPDSYNTNTVHLTFQEFPRSRW